MSNVISLKGVSKSFGDTHALQQVDLDVPAGCVVGLVGVNGAGKTTLICSMMGSTFPDEGEVVLFGEPLSADSSADAIRRCRSRIGFVLDTNPLPSDLTLSQVGEIMRLAYSQWDPGEYERLCARFKLDGKATVKSLSRGMSMKLQLACALSHHADALVLDEATAGLDPLARDEVLEVLGNFMRDEQHAVLLSSHITTDLEKIADVIVGIDGGRVFFQVEKDVITDEMGIARCTKDDCERLVSSGVFAPGELWVLERDRSTDVLVPDRRKFARAFPALACDRASIDEFLQMRMKGEQR